MRGIKWSNTWKNLDKVRGLNATETEFLWKMTLDMLLIGGRIHRANVDKECKNDVDGQECKVIPDLVHTFVSCKGIEKDFVALVDLIKKVLNFEIKMKEIITISFTHRNVKRRWVTVWLVAKVMYGMYKKEDLRVILEHIVVDLEWLLQSRVRVGSCEEMNRLRDIVRTYLIVPQIRH